MTEWFGLYYRHVHFRDERWLNLTALYWDRLYRFHADDAVSTLPRISHAEIALYDAGFVRQTVPGYADVQRVADRFIAALEGVDLSRYAVPRSQTLAPYELGEGLARWKASGQLIDKLTSLDLATDHSGAAGRIRMNTTLAHAYLLLLGSQVASGYGATPLADVEFAIRRPGWGRGDWWRVF